MSWLLEGGGAEAAGVRVGDEVVRVGGTDPMAFLGSGAIALDRPFEVVVRRNEREVFLTVLPTELHPEPASDGVDGSNPE